METKYTEIFRLEKMLIENEIPYENIDRIKMMENHSKSLSDDFIHQMRLYQLVYPNSRQTRVSIIEGFGTYGADNNLLEIWCKGEDEPRGYLTAEEVLNTIKKHEEDCKNGK